MHPSRLAALALACCSCRMLYWTSEDNESTSSSFTSDPEATTTSSDASSGTTTPAPDLPPTDPPTDPYLHCEQTPATASPDDPLCHPDRLTPGTDNPDCDADCTVPTCGDAHLNQAAGEQCDGDATCDEFCRHKCGNGRLDASPPEECDDGNTDDDDACSPTCTKTGLLVFVSSATFNGNFEGNIQAVFPKGVNDILGYGIGDADMVCRNLAVAAVEAVDGLPWQIPQPTDENHGIRAWLSHSLYHPSGDPPGGFHKCARQYFLPIRNADAAYTFEPVGQFFTDDNGDNDDTGGGDTRVLSHPIDHTESGLPIGSDNEELRVWTNTSASGDLALAPHCNNWTSDHQNTTALYGKLTESNLEWTAQDLATCDLSLRIYCFEQCPSDAP